MDITLIFIVVMVLGGLLQLFYFLYFFLRLALYKSPEIPVETPTSIIICAKNEEKQLRENLPLILDQTHSNFEVIVVNDSSWDDTKEILDAFEASYKNLKVIHLDEEKHLVTGKKFALTLGIKACKNEHLVFIDADCQPSSRSWLQNMAPTDSSKEVILGYSPFKAEKTLINLLNRYDAFHTAVQYLSFALAQMPYMGVGRNLAYTSSLFFSVGGFKTHYHIISGDDDLFVNQVATKNNTAIMIKPEAHTVSESEKLWKKWFYQKKRHLTSGVQYKLKHKLLVAGYPLSLLLFYIGLFGSLFFINNPLVIVGIFLLRWMIQIAIFSTMNKHLNAGNMVFFAPFLELFTIIFGAVVFFSNLVSKPNKWK